MPPYHDPWAATVPVPGPAATPYSAPPVSSPTPGNALYPITQPYPAPEPVIAQIGEIQVTSSSIRTPTGMFPLRHSQWTATDTWTTEQKIPTWAIVLSIVLFFCVGPFSLLFLLAKESVYRAVVQVHVAGQGWQYVARIPAADQTQVQYLYQQVNYVRSLAAA
jgi:hypothetical protein